MKNNFKAFETEFREKFNSVKTATSLDILRSRYYDLQICREELLDWVSSTYDENTDEYENVIRQITKLEHSTILSENSVPSFDGSTSYDKIDEIFDYYISYFQRYGCLDSSSVLSWDSENVLIEDELGNAEIIKRPDVLLN
jgi:hypothetical protein